MVCIDLDDLSILRPVVHTMLWKRAKRSKPRAHGQYNVSFADQFHTRLGALVAKRPAPQGVACWKRIIVQVAVDDRYPQPFRERFAFVDAAGIDDSASRNDDGKFRRR